MFISKTNIIEREIEREREREREKKKSRQSFPSLS
jgi:hypothetical protein